MYRNAVSSLLRGAARGGLLGAWRVNTALPSPHAALLASQQLHTMSSESENNSGGNRVFWYGLMAGLGATALAAATDFALADEAEHGLEPGQYPWSHDGWLTSFDHQSIRRGHQVYTEVCAACHSVERLHYRNLVDVCYTEEEAKTMASEAEVEDGPNDEGEMFTRPGRLSDPLPRPYANEAAARYANGGAYPPDLTLITKARHDGVNYVFSLLLGYRDAPAGVQVREGLHYNPYFPGGAIAMPKMLADEGVEYEDGTFASEAQQAKDVATFLAWAAEPEHDDRKLMGVKWIAVLCVLAVCSAYLKRFRWAPLKSRRIIIDTIN